jgi:hypothetical protein
MRVLYFLNRYFSLFMLVLACIYILGSIPFEVCRRSWYVLTITWQLAIWCVFLLFLLMTHRLGE